MEFLPSVFYPKGKNTLVERIHCYNFSMVIFMIIRETDSLFSVSFLQAVAIYGVTEGIKDPSIFNVPAVCKSKERTVHVSHVLMD